MPYFRQQVIIFVFIGRKQMEPQKETFKSLLAVLDSLYTKYKKIMDSIDYDVDNKTSALKYEQINYCLSKLDNAKITIMSAMQGLAETLDNVDFC